MRFNYDRAALAKAVKTKRLIENSLMMREAGEQADVGHCCIFRAEKEKGLRRSSFDKICKWLEVQPETFLENEGMDNGGH